MRKHEVILFAIGLVSVQCGSFAQSVPPLINYQGRLTDQTGNAMAPGGYILQFRIWNDPLAAALTNLIWGQQQSVTIQTNGVFNVILGAATGNSLPGTSLVVTNLLSAFGSSNSFLGLTVADGPTGVVATPTEIAPRQQLLSVPFAIQSIQAQFAQQASSLVSNLANALCPPGTISAFGGNIVPPGWLLCNGSALSSLQYPQLFAAIDTNWGSGVLSTTNNFSLPDLRGMFLRGVNGTRADAFADPDAASRTSLTPYANSGNEVGSYQMNQVESHSHGISLYGIGNGGDTGPGWTGGGAPAPGGGTAAAGGSEDRPKNAYVNYIIKY